MLGALSPSASTSLPHRKNKAVNVVSIFVVEMKYNKYDNIIIKYNNIII